MAKRTTKNKSKLSAKRRKLLVEEIQSEQHNISTEALETLWNQEHFKEYPNRSKFRELVKANNKTLLRCIDTMENAYKKLLKAFCPGKKLLQMRQAWLMHINFYVEEGTDLLVKGLDDHDKKIMFAGWKAVIDEATFLGILLSVEEQRIIVSSIAFIVSDIMSDKVKEAKKRADEETSPDTTAHESYVAVNRYAGAALSSMIDNRFKISCNHNELKFLYLMVARCSLSKGGSSNCFVEVSSDMFAFFRLLLSTILSLINQDMLKKQGKQMIKVAKEKILDDQEIELAFNICFETIVQESESARIQEYEKSVLDHLKTELVKKVFHSRVNEFMEAKKELDLERKGKVTNADQSLRYVLKTYSGNQVRH